MNRDLGLRLLSQIMQWNDEQPIDEFQWLSFMAAYKYDGYRDFHAGARFLECLAKWLQQFDQQDRAVAYEFVKKKLIYFSPPEIQRLVEKFFPEYVQKHLIHHVSKNLSIPNFRVWATQKSQEEYQWELRKTLFMALSDGARIDVLRRMNVGTISNEQIVIATQVDQHKWKSLLKDLREDLEKLRGKSKAEGEKFARVYLLDDFTASGTSFLPDPKNVGELKGKLVKFLNSVIAAKEEGDGESPFVDNFEIYVHHYIGTIEAKENIERVYNEIKSESIFQNIGDVHFNFGLLLPRELKIDENSDEPFAQLCIKYYDCAIEGKGKHGGQSGTKSKVYGYANCGMPIVLEHNTPNNSLSILWAETNNTNDSHNMTPLFRRRERHSDLDQEQQTEGIAHD